jgi:hypothetical protein
MTKIYIDGFFCSFANVNAIQFKNHQEIPNNCNLVALAIYQINYENFIPIIDSLLSKSNKILVYLSEPTHQQQFLKFINHYKNSNKVYVFSDVVLNIPTPDNFSTAISWFISPENFYNSNLAVIRLLGRLAPVDQDLRPAMFDCLLGCQRQHRDQIENLYLQSNCQDKIIFNYYKHNQYIDHGIWENLDVCHNRYAIVPVSVYNQSYYSIVAETTAYNSYNQYTEKVAKPIMALRPFVAFAGQHYLENLKTLGFRTFDSVIDENYDSIPDEQERINAAWHQVEWLCTQDPQQIYHELSETLVHNRQHFIRTNWHLNIQKHFE